MKRGKILEIMDRELNGKTNRADLFLAKYDEFHDSMEKALAEMLEEHFCWAYRLGLADGKNKMKDYLLSFNVRRDREKMQKS